MPIDRLDFKGKDMSGFGFVGLNLDGANFSGADLRCANLSDTSLISAYFSEARLFGAKFNNANLTNAVFHEADLNGVDLSQANLTNADFTGATLVNADLSKANLTRAIFKNTDLSGVDLSETNLTEDNISTSKEIEMRYAREILQLIAMPGNSLDMSEWHTCQTAHCIAGWLFPDLNYPAIAASAIVPTLAQYFFSPNQEAYKALVRVAAGEESVFDVPEKGQYNC